MFKKLLATTAAAFALSGAVSLTHAQEINFGIISTDSTQALKARWQPLIDDMAKQTGLTIKPFFAPDYAGVIEGMRFNKVQVGWFGNKSAMEAVDRSDGEIFAQMVRADGTLGYYSYMIVNKDSPINNIDEMLKAAKTLSFSNGDPNSTSGNLVPGYYVFAKNHVDAKTAFKIFRTGNHESNGLAVAAKQVDVATFNSEQMDIMKANAPDKVKELKVIWTSPLIPSDPLVIRKDVPAATKEKIAKFFVNYGKTDEREKEILDDVAKLSGFKPSTNDQLIPIRELDLFSKRLKLETDTTMADADKKKAIADIDSKLAALKK